MRPPRANTYRDAWAGELDATRVGDTVRVAGWVHRRRDHGGLVFIDLRDRSGILQLVFHPEDSPRAHELAQQLRSEHAISVSGEIVRREEGKENPRLKTGEIELSVREAEHLAASETPPFPLDDDTPVDEALRLRHRMIDLRRDSMRDSLTLRHTITRAMRDYLNAHDFLDIETPILTRSTPEGARDFLVPARISPGAFYALPQSPQLFKQLLMMSGYERYYQIARCFRDESSRADRQPEFTQLDLEMSFVEEDDVIETIEGMLARVFEETGFEAPPPPWPQLGYDEAMARFGSDRPDTRFGLEIQDLSEAVAGSEFKVFATAEVVRGINAGAREVPRRELDELTELVKRFGAGGLVWAFVEEDGSWRSPIAKFLSDDERAAIGRLLSAQPGDLLLAVADKPAVAAQALGELRLELSRRFDLTAGAGHALLWVVDFPMFEWNEEEGRWDAMHHPFTAPGRLVRGSGLAAQPRLRRRARRLGDRRRVDPYQPPRGPAAGLQGARHQRGGGRGALRLPARGAALRRAAARRDRARHRPDRGAARRPRLDPRHDRLPQDGERLGSAHGRPGAGRRRAALRARDAAHCTPANVGFAPQSGSTFAARVPIREVVSQISPPIRIVLVLAVAVLGAYMLFLRPKPEEIPPVEPAGTSTSQPGQVRDAAEDAVDAANSQLQQQESVDGVDAGESAAGTTPATKAGKQGNAAKGAAAGEPAQDLKGLPKPVRKAIRDNKVLVVLFSNGKSYDDKAVEKALTKVNRWDGRVFVHTAPLRKISKYGRIARGVSVEQSPTVVVADRTLRAETLVGYVDRTTIDQAVVDARQNSTGVYVDSYLKTADKTCFAHSNQWDSVPFYYLGNGTSSRQLDRRLAELDVVWASFIADYAAVKAPAKHRAFHRATVADMKAYGAELHKVSGAVTPKLKRAVALDRIASGQAVVTPIAKRTAKRFTGANLARCGTQF